jgi:endo-1,4-beta-xylanase
VTELDVDGNNDNVQLAGMQKIFPLYWEHPAVTGVTLWGYKQGNHWRNAQGAWLVWSGASAGAERPAMQWLHRYVNNQPTHIPFQTFNVPANAPEGSTVGTVVATDGDPGTVFSQWRIETSGGFSTVPGNGLFSINPDNGTLSVAAALSAVPKGTVFKQHVSVWDGYQRSTVRRVEITVN